MNAVTASPRGGGTRWVDLSLVLATMVNPLNSTMLSVGLVTLAHAFDVGIGTTTLLVVAFYATGAVAQPIMGRLADSLGPRRTLRLGMAIALLVSVGAANAPGFAWLVVARAGLALGTSAAYPSALAMLRARRGPDGPAPTGSLTGISVGNALSTTLGPPSAGALIALGGWQLLFWFNVPLTAAVLAMSFVLHPPDPPRRSDASPATGFDFGGVVLFSAAIGALYAVTSTHGPLLVSAVAGLILTVAALCAYERRQPDPLIDVRFLARARRLRNVYVAFVSFTLVWYSLAIGLPIWLQAGYGLSAGGAGLLMVPSALATIFISPLAARLTDRRGPRPTTTIGVGLLLISCLSVATFTSGTGVLQIVLTGLTAGAAGALLNVSLQVRLYDASPVDGTGAAAGLYQSFRYIGAILAAGLVTATLGQVNADTTMLAAGLAMSALCVGELGIDLRQRHVTAGAPDA